MFLENQILFYFGVKYYDGKKYYPSDVELGKYYQTHKSLYGVSSNYLIEMQNNSIPLSSIFFVVKNIIMGDYCIKGDITILKNPLGQSLKILIEKGWFFNFRPVINNGVINKFVVKHMIYEEEKMMMREVKLKYLLGEIKI